MEEYNILVIDDDEIFGDRLTRAIVSRGHQGTYCSSVDDALEVLPKVSPTHIVLDLKMPKVSGLQAIDLLLKSNPLLKILILTGYSSVATAMDAIGRGAVNYIPKPATCDDILSAFAGPAIHSRKSVHNLPTLYDIEREHIERVLNECDGNISKAAKILGLHRRSLQRKIST